jgi:two-component system phosphate regulon sensor histidine kinase PhoR
LRAAGEIAGVPSELQSALSNLISNAVRYTPAGGTITVQWRYTADGNVHFFRERHRARHCARAHSAHDRALLPRGPQPSRETGGTGLGLAIVKHVLQRHGATLDITSALGKGSVFSVTFPANRFAHGALPRGCNPQHQHKQPCGDGSASALAAQNGAGWAPMGQTRGTPAR